MLAGDLVMFGQELREPQALELLDLVVAELETLLFPLVQAAQVQLTPGAVVVQTVLAALALLSCATQILLRWLRLQQVRPQLQPLADFVSIGGQALAQSHSEIRHGSLCTTQ
jgi:hypothetical protein